MAFFELRYPNETSPTTSWLPSLDPEVRGSEQDDDDGMLVDVMADGATSFAYQTADDAFREHEASFFGLSQTDKANFSTFRLAAKGESFRLIDAALSDCGSDTTAYVTVKFAPGGFERRWRQLPNKRWAVTLRFRET